MATGFDQNNRFTTESSPSSQTCSASPEAVATAASNVTSRPVRTATCSRRWGYKAQIEEINRTLGIPENYGDSRRLVLQTEAPPSELHLITDDWDIHPVRLFAPAASAWFRLNAAAAAEHVVLVPLSGFRSVARQLEIFRRKLAKGIPITEILKLNAAPGYSEHHTGRAVDISTPGQQPFAESFGETPAFEWLNRHAGEYGFRLSYPRENPHGISYEPWHWWWDSESG